MGSVSHSCVLSLVRPHTCYVDPLLDIIGRHVRIGMLLFRYKRSSNREADVLTANQISSWWGGSGSSAPAVQDKPYDPTDPKQNPLNPKGLKPYVFHCP